MNLFLLSHLRVEQSVIRLSPLRVEHTPPSKLFLRGIQCEAKCRYRSDKYYRKLKKVCAENEMETSVFLSSNLSRHQSQDTWDKIQDNFINPLRTWNPLPLKGIAYIRHCTIDPYSHSSQNTIHSYNRPHIHSQNIPPFLFYPPLRHSRTPTHCRWALCLSACLLIVCPNGRWDERM